jgi:hypothetical protein
METFQVNGDPVILDGCHNDDSVRQFMTGVKEKYPKHKLTVLFGAGAEKHLGDMLQSVFEYADTVLMVQSKHFKALSEVDLVDAVPADKAHLLLREQQEVQCRELLEGSPFMNWAPKQLPKQVEGTVAARLRWLLETPRRYVLYLTLFFLFDRQIARSSYLYVKRRIWCL